MPGRMKETDVQLLLLNTEWVERKLEIIDVRTDVLWRFPNEYTHAKFCTFHFNTDKNMLMRLTSSVAYWTKQQTIL